MGKISILPILKGLPREERDSCKAYTLNDNGWHKPPRKMPQSHTFGAPCRAGLRLSPHRPGHFW